MITQERIEELREADFPRLSSLMTHHLDDEVVEYLEKVGDLFVLDEDGKCINCRMTVGGLLGTFTWGIIHGEGFCSHCGWPIRYYHYYGGDERKMFTSLLQYHPDEVEEVK